MLHSQHQKIDLFKKAEMPINYRGLAVDASGQLKERKSLLDKRVVEGYGVIWGSKNTFGEIFTKGAFSKSIADNGPGSKAAYQIKFRDEHGRSCSLFEELKEDETGLYFRTVALDDVQWCNDLLVQLRSGTINNFSIGFKHVWDKVQWDDETDTMVNIEARLFEISAVSIPSDINTFAMRSAEDGENLMEEIEDFISTLDRAKRLQARKLITRSMSLGYEEPLKVRQQALVEEPKPTKTELDLKYIYDHLKF